VVLVLFHSILAFAIAVLTVIKLGESITYIFFLVLVDAFPGFKVGEYCGLNIQHSGPTRASSSFWEQRKAIPPDLIKSPSDLEANRSELSLTRFNFHCTTSSLF